MQQRILKFELTAWQTQRFRRWLAALRRRAARQGRPLEQITLAFTLTPWGTQILADVDYALREPGINDPTPGQLLLQEAFDDGFELTDLQPTDSGLPCLIYLCTNILLWRRRIPRLYVETAPGQPRVPVSIVDEPVVLREEPGLIAFGYQAMDRATFTTVKRFIRRHRTALLRHWRGETDSAEVLRELKLLDPSEKPQDGPSAPSGLD